ncbi:MAG: hypothetical protein ABI609_15805 [Acidobacteriota bacterium]
MNRPWRVVSLAGSLLVGTVAIPAGAQTALWQRFAIEGGAYEARGDSTLRVDANASALGTTINFEDDLGLEPTDRVAQGRIEWFLASRHELSLRGYRTERTGETGSSPFFRFGDFNFPAGHFVRTSFSLDQTELAYSYWFLQQPHFGVALELGAVEISTRAEVHLTGMSPLPLAARAGVMEERAAVLPLTIVLGVTASAKVAVPLIGGQFRALVGNSLILSGGVRFLPGVKVGDSRGDMWLGDVALEWRPLPHVGIGAAYQSSRLRLDFSQSGWHGRADLTTKGPAAFLRLGW